MLLKTQIKKLKNACIKATESSMRNATENFIVALELLMNCTKWHLAEKVL